MPHLEHTSKVFENFVIKLLGKKLCELSGYLNCDEDAIDFEN